MAEKPTSTESLGIEIDLNSLKGAELVMAKGKPKLLNVFEVPIDQDNVKLLYTDQEKSNLKQLLDKNLVVTPLPTTGILVRQLEVSLTKEKDVDSVFEFQTEPLLPFPAEEGVVDRITLHKGAESTTLTVVAAPKKNVSEHLSHCHSIEVEPEVLSCIPAALASFSKLFADSKKPCILLHLGFDHVTATLVEDGKLVSALSTEKGLKTLNNGQDPLVSDVTRITLSLAKQVSENTPPGLIFTGEGVENRQLTNVLTQKIELKKLPLQEVKGFTIPEIKLLKYAVPIGSALTALNKNYNQINFRQGEYAYPFPLRRVQTPLLTYLSLTLIAAATFYLFGASYLAYQKDQVRKEYVGLLTDMGKPLTESEKNSPLELSPGEISQRLNLLDKELRTTPDLFPLLPNTPRVSDVLAWLSTHPQVTGEDSKIRLTSFNYKMVKRPEESKKRVRYQAKVEIEFTTPVPRHARELHDALLSPNKYVDPNYDVKWGTERGKYRASFFLKDKTLYPQ